MDARARDSGIPSTYAGNATLFAQIEPTNVKQLVEYSLAEVALWFRKEIISLNKSGVADVVSFLSQFTTNDLHEAFFYAPPYLHISNWDSLGDLTAYDFGTGPACAVRLPPPGVDSIFYILPSVGGVECVIGLAPEVLSKFSADEELLQAGAEFVGEFSKLNPATQL